MLFGWPMETTKYGGVCGRKIVHTCPWNDISEPPHFVIRVFPYMVRDGLYTYEHALKYIPEMDKVIVSGLTAWPLTGRHGDGVLCVFTAGLLVRVVCSCRGGI